VLQEYKNRYGLLVLLDTFQGMERMNIAAKETGWEVHNRQRGMGSVYQEKL